MNKTLFEATTLDGGMCIFYVENVHNIELLPETKSVLEDVVYPKRVRVTLDNGNIYLIFEKDYERLVENLRNL